MMPATLVIILFCQLCQLTPVSMAHGASPEPVDPRALQDPRDPPAPPASIALQEQISLAALLDLCAKRLSLDLEFDAEALRKVTTTVRTSQGLDERELWSVTNRILAGNGWTSIGHPSGNLLSIVRLADAAKRAPIVRSLEAAGQAGFVTVERTIQRASVSGALKVAESLKSDPGGAVRTVGDTGTLLISDLRPRVIDILRVLDELDGIDEGSGGVVEQIALSHLDAAQLVAQVNAAVVVRDSIESRPLRGKVMASLAGDGVIIVAPRGATAEWRSLVAQFDQREPIVTRTYSPRHFSVSEVSRLIEQTARARRGGAGPDWRLVHDTLTGTIVVTATAREHDLIEQLLTRLAEAPAHARRPVRTFVIKHRNVAEVVSILNGLVEQDALTPEVESNHNATSPQTNRDHPPDTVAPSPAQPPAPSTPPTESVPAPATRSDQAVVLLADGTTNTLIAVGESHLLARVESLLQALDVRHPQVQLEFIIVSLSQGDTLDLGVELRKLEISGSTLIGLGSLFGLSTLSMDATSVRPAGRGFSGVVLSPGDFSVVMRALETVNRGASRSMPSVLVNNNQQATLDSVIQEPFSSTNASDTVATTSFGGTQDAGTQVTITPHIAAGDYLTLEYSVSLSAFVGESNDPALPPPRQQTRLQSTVTIPDGFTIAIGGLEVLSDGGAVSQVPFLGSIPVLGEAFKSRSQAVSRSRFLVFIRASILRHDGFEDLKYLSRPAISETAIDDGWPTLSPQIIRSTAQRPAMDSHPWSP